MKHITIRVENIKCGGCENSIRKEVLQQSGILAVHVDGEHQIVSITGEDDMARSQIVSCLEHLGYPESGHNSLLFKVKSFGSCAVGRMTDKVG
jgi:copper chaperone CopZ